MSPSVVRVPRAPRVVLASVEALVRGVAVQADAAAPHNARQVPAHPLRVLEDAPSPRPRPRARPCPRPRGSPGASARPARGRGAEPLPRATISRPG